MGGAVTFIIIVLLFAALIPSLIAAKKGRNPIVWYLYGFFLFIFAMVHSVMLEPPRRCGFCDEGIRPKARVCPHCTRDLAAEPVARARKPATLQLERA